MGQNVNETLKYWTYFMNKKWISFWNDLFYLVNSITSFICKLTYLSLGSISSTFNKLLLRTRIPKAQKMQSNCQSFLHFRDLQAQKLLVECWRNWPQVAVLYWFKFKFIFFSFMFDTRALKQSNISAIQSKNIKKQYLMKYNIAFTETV